MIAAQFPEGFVAKWAATLQGARFFGQTFDEFDRDDLLAIVGWLIDGKSRAESRERDATRREFDAFRPYRKNGPDRRQVVYWPEVDRRNADREARRAIDRLIGDKS